MFGILVFLAMSAILVGLVLALAQRSALAAAKRAYAVALAALEQHPESVDLRTTALAAGRRYAAAARRVAGKKGRAVFDEVALSNDLSARVGAAPERQQSETPTTMSQPDVHMKACPDCAEAVRAAARKCRYCGFVFDAPTHTGEHSKDPVASMD